MEINTTGPMDTVELPLRGKSAAKDDPVLIPEAPSGRMLKHVCMILCLP